jgi:protein involved in polysaccharide export with SLBB domain
MSCSRIDMIGVGPLPTWIDFFRRRRQQTFSDPLWRFSTAIAASFALSGLMTQTGFASPVIHPGDRVAVKVYNRPELSSTITVDSRGYLAMPLAGEIQASGLDPGSLADKIKTGLTPYMRYPAVEVQIAGEGSSVFVQGGPVGVIPYQPGQTLAEAVSQIKTVDSQTKDANAPATDLAHSGVDLSRVGVQRDGQSLGNFAVISPTGRGESGPVLAAGDTIVLVNKPIPVNIEGDVTHPGTTYLNRTEPLSDAISQLGGLTPTSANAQVSVVRDGATELHGLGEPIFKESAHSGDRVVIPTAPRVMIAGMVTTPGPVVLKSDFTLLSALFNAGGPNKYANLKIVQVVHQSQKTQYDITKLTHGDLSQNPVLADGDVVFVPEGHKIDVSTFFSAISAGRAVFPYYRP